MNRLPVLLKILFSCGSLLLVFYHGVSQKFNFINYGIEDGLVQSQVNNIGEDQQGRLWMSTLGGISCFDGTRFTNYNYTDGLLHSSINKVMVDHKNQVWIIASGIIQKYDHRVFRDYSYDHDTIRFTARDVVETKDHQLYFISQRRSLLHYDANADRIENADPPPGLITGMVSDSNNLFAFCKDAGLYKYNQNTKWNLVSPWPAHDSLKLVRYLLKMNNAWILAGRDFIYSWKNEQLKDVGIKITSIISSIAMNPHAANSFFVGTSQGAFQYNLEGESIPLNLKNGLTNNTVNHIFNDHEGNTWFSTDGVGIFKYGGETFKLIDISQGLNGNIVMSIVQNKSGVMYAGSLDQGLTEIKNGQCKSLKIPSSLPEANKIQSLLVDKFDQSLYIVSIGSGLWRYLNGNFSCITKDRKYIHGINCLYQSQDGTVWIAGNGVSYCRNHKVEAVKEANFIVMSMFQLSPDSILVGTAGSVKLFDGKNKFTPFNIKGTENLSIGNIVQWKNNIVLGSSENGIIIWPKGHSQDSTFTCNQKDGLSSNMVFSLLPDQDRLYAGTINGLQSIVHNPTSNQFVITPLRANNLKLGPECNQNAILKDDHGIIWLGTTGGIVLFNPDYIQHPSSPRLILKHIDINNQNQDSLLDSNHTMMLSFRQNHLRFEVNGIHLTSPENLQYVFKLDGADQKYSDPQTSPSVVYPNLPHGFYNFKAKALIEQKDTTLYSDEISFPFEIKPPLYKTKWFQLSSVLFLIGLGAWTQKYRSILKARHQAMIDRIRKQEQLKIQERTSEDLHDDLGNKITRLALLTDVLYTKISGNESDQLKLIKQIKENIQGLYMGTKDIIWALSPNNYSMAEAINRIQQYGIELFLETQISFSSKPVDDGFNDIKPPFEFSRNLIMICKEALHNILKHSEAKNASIEFIKPDPKDHYSFIILIKDDGKGIDIEKINKGNGLENMNKRIARLNGKIELDHHLPTGTVIIVRLKIPPSEG